VVVNPLIADVLPSISFSISIIFVLILLISETEVFTIPEIFVTSVCSALSADVLALVLTEAVNSLSTRVTSEANAELAVTAESAVD